MQAEGLRPYFANAAGQVREHPDGYGLVCYRAGPRRAGELLALLTHAGQLLRARGWNRLLSDQRQMSPYTPAEQTMIATYWASWQQTCFTRLYMAVVAAPG